MSSLNDTLHGAMMEAVRLRDAVEDERAAQVFGHLADVLDMAARVAYVAEARPDDGLYLAGRTAELLEAAEKLAAVYRTEASVDG